MFARLLSAACAQRGGGFTQAGGIGKAWTRAGSAVRHEVSDEPHPRLRQTARCLQVFFIFLIARFNYRN